MLGRQNHEMARQYGMCSGEGRMLVGMGNRFWNAGRIRGAVDKGGLGN